MDSGQGSTYSEGDDNVSHLLVYSSLFLIKGMEAGQLAHLTHQAMDVGTLLPQLTLARHQVGGTQLPIRATGGGRGRLLVAGPDHLGIGDVVCRGQGCADVSLTCRDRWDNHFTLR